MNVQVTAYGRQTVSDMGVVKSCDPLQNFWGFNHITGMAEPKVIKFCTRIGYINSDSRMTYHHQKGRGCGHVTVYKFCRLSWCSVHRAGLSATAELLVRLTFAFTRNQRFKMQNFRFPTARCTQHITCWLQHHASANSKVRLSWSLKIVHLGGQNIYIGWSDVTVICDLYVVMKVIILGEVNWWRFVMLFK